MKVLKLVKVKVYTDPKSQARLGPVASALVSSLPKAALLTAAVLTSAGCTVIKYKNKDVEFTHISPIFVKRDIRDLDLLQGKMSGSSTELDPRSAEVISAGAAAGAAAAMRLVNKP